MQTTANSGGGQAQAAGGGQLLQELEALNQALYQAGQQQGNNVSSKRLARRETMPARVEEVADADTLGKLLRSSHPKPPPVTRAKSFFDPGKKSESHSYGGEYSEDDEVSNLSDSVDGEDFQKRLEVSAAAEKKKGLWSWKPFRALAHVGQQKFNCLFTVHVHGIEGLPASVNGLRLGVHFAKKDDVGVQTLPSRVSHGHCEFQETLNTRCSIHGTKNGAKGMKWEAKQFVLTVIALDVDELVLARHKLELTRLLPESIEDDVAKQDMWTTTFKLAGKAQGGTLIVTFGAEIQSKDLGNISASSSARFQESPALRAVRSFNSLPNSGNATPRYGSDKDQHSPSMSEPSAECRAMEHLSLDDFNHDGLYRGSYSDQQASSPQDAKAHEKVNAGAEEDDEEEVEFTVIEKGVEVSTIIDSVPARSYDAFESGNTFDLEEKRVDVSRPEELYNDREPENRYQEYEDEGADVVEGSDYVEQVNDDKDSRGQSESLTDSKLMSRSIDDEMEMQELLASLGEQERDAGDVEGVDFSHDVQTIDVQDDMTEEELLSLLPGGNQWESSKKAPQSKGLESDDEFDNVAGEFLSLLGDDAQPSPAPGTPDNDVDSPRALLFKQFETEAMIESGLGLNLKMPELTSSVEQSELSDYNLDGVSRDHSVDVRLMNEPHSQYQYTNSENQYTGAEDQYTGAEDFNNLGWGSEEDTELASIMEAAESELQKATQTMRSKNRAKLLEDQETEALMREWGVNKKVFEGSTKTSTYADETGNNFAMVSYEPPPLGFGLGSVVPTQDGGSLMSMSPYNFQATSDSKLVMQVSKPVVVPTEMGAQSLDILLRMASAGIDGMTNQAMVTMPLDDITGKSVEQIASEGFAAFRGGNHLAGGEYGYPALEGGHPPYSLEYPQDSSSHSLTTVGSRAGSSSNALAARTQARRSNPNATDDSFASLEDLAPVAMAKIEALALEGLKIQADMAEEEAPYMVEPFSKHGRIEGGQGKPEMKYLEDASSMSFFDDENADDASMADDFSMAISLDEWMRLDAGVVDENEIQDDTMALVAAHHATHGDIVPGTANRQPGKQKVDSGSTEQGGHMGNTITLAMLVQLRDPLRNFEPIGAPMMALVQAERVAVPPMPKLRFGKQISLRGNNERYDDPPTQPLFKITDVTLSGMKMSEETANADKHKNQKQIGWGNPKQQQSGSRWLAASGMVNKNAKVPVPKAKGIPTPSQGVPRPASYPAPPPAAAAAPPPSRAPPVHAVPTPAKSSSKIDSLWSLSAKITSRWGGTPSVSKVRNPDVVVSKTGWFGRKK